VRTLVLASLSSSRSARAAERRGNDFEHQLPPTGRIAGRSRALFGLGADALYVVTLGRTNQSRWQLSVARRRSSTRTVVFTWEQTRGITSSSSMHGQK
jgi:hypothetical protein